MFSCRTEAVAAAIGEEVCAPLSVCQYLLIPPFCTRLHLQTHSTHRPIFPSLKPQRRGVDAVTLARRRRPVVEDVPEMRSALGAVDFRPRHDPARVLRLRHTVLAHRLREARPARAGVEFRARVEERASADNARVDALLMVVPEAARERLLRSALLRHVVLLGREGLAKIIPRGLSFGILHADTVLR